MVPLSGGNTTKRVLASILVGLVLMVAGATVNSIVGSSAQLREAVSDHGRRIVVMEERLLSVVRTLERCEVEIKENRSEARGDSKLIIDRLDRLIEKARGAADR